MTDKEISYISLIAKYGNITKAAEQLFIAQPSLTQALRRIEAEYGVEFFYRTHSGLKLTEAGQAYLDAASKIEKLYAKMERELGRTERADGNLFYLGVTQTMGTILLPELFAACKERTPPIHLSILEAPAGRLERLLAEKKLDLAILYRPFQSVEANYIALGRDELLLAVAGNHAVCRQHSRRQQREYPLATPDIMQTQPYIMPAVNHYLHQMANSIFSAANVVPSTVFSTASIETALSLAASGVGAAFVPKSSARFYSAKYSPAYFRFPAEWNGGWEVVAAYRNSKSLSETCLEVISVLQACVASMSEVFL